MHKVIASSFRDPSGSVFLKDGMIHRRINLSYKEDYEHLMGSGLYEELVSSGLLISHREVDLRMDREDGLYRVIIPEQVPFISYPYEWCFSQLKEAALLTLKIEETALKFGMCLKDSSAYNTQFHNGRSFLIDTLSFRKYYQGEPWVAYKQFCQHFVAPLALMAYVDIRLGQLMKNNIDGIPLDLARSLLPFSSMFNMRLMLHLHLHAHAQKRWKGGHAVRRLQARSLSRYSIFGLIDNLKSLVSGMTYFSETTEWSRYYPDSESYAPEALAHKKELVSGFIDRIKPKNAWDIGANTGLFSRIAGNKGIPTISFDVDPVCAEINYLDKIKNKETNILPLIMDLANPSPGIGWENRERLSFIERGPVDVVMALALVHHLAVSNNLPFHKIVSLMKDICRWLIIEYIPKEDAMVKKLLSSREDIFNDYTAQAFESEFAKEFNIRASVKIRGSDRTLYLMEKK